MDQTFFGGAANCRNILTFLNNFLSYAAGHYFEIYLNAFGPWTPRGTAGLNEEGRGLEVMGRKAKGEKEKLSLAENSLYLSK